MPLNKKVKYTSRANPTIWSHLNVSHPRPRETIQMNRVLQVSIVDLEVALTLRVTERPKKLKPLGSVSETRLSKAKIRFLPNANHDENTREQDLLVPNHLVPTIDHVKVAVSAGGGGADGRVQDDHG